MRKKIVYIIFSALTLSIITGITPASAKSTSSKSTSSNSAPATKTAYVSPPANPTPPPAKAPATFTYYQPVLPPAPKPIPLPSLLASYSSAVTTKATETKSYSTFSNGGSTSTAATTTKSVAPKIETIPPIKTSLPKIGSSLMAYEYTTGTTPGTKTVAVQKTDLAGKSEISTVAQDFIKTSLIAKPAADIKKTSMAADLAKIKSSTGLDTALVGGGKVTTYTPGKDVITLSTTITTNTKYNSTDKINTTANQKEILNNVNAVTSKGLNTLLIQATADSTGKADYNLGLSQLRAEADLKNYATTMEKNGYSSKDGQWKDANGNNVSASSCTKLCTYTLKGESSPTIQLLAKGLGEVTTKSPGALGEKQKEIEAKNCSNSRAGSCAALHDKQRVTMVGGVFDSTLIKVKSTDSCPPGDCPPPPTCIERGDCPPPPTCTQRGDCPPPPTCTQRGDCPPPTTTCAQRGDCPPTVPTTTVNPGSTTTSSLPSTGSPTTSGGTGTTTAPSGVGSTTRSGSSSSGSTGTPTSGVSGSAGSSSSGSSLLPPASGFGSTPATGGSTSTPSTGGTSSNPTPAPKFKVS